MEARHCQCCEIHDHCPLPELLLHQHLPWCVQAVDEEPQECWKPSVIISGESVTLPKYSVNTLTLRLRTGRITQIWPSPSRMPWSRSLSACQASQSTWHACCKEVRRRAEAGKEVERGGIIWGSGHQSAGIHKFHARLRKR